MSKNHIIALQPMYEPTVASLFLAVSASCCYTLMTASPSNIHWTPLNKYDNQQHKQQQPGPELGPHISIRLRTMMEAVIVSPDNWEIQIQNSIDTIGSKKSTLKGCRQKHCEPFTRFEPTICK